jgi:cysteinyl-tRNA synthetase
MLRRVLGDRVDVHGGGSDLRFPHHENEIAQSEAATGASPVAAYWVHNGMVTVRDEKMAKSLGNAVGVADVLARHSREAVRAWFLLAHYRTPLEASERAVSDAGVAVERLHAALAHLVTGIARPGAAAGRRARDAAREAARRVRAALDDDLDTPAALGALFDLASEARRLVGEETNPSAAAPAGLADAVEALVQTAAPLGVLRADPAAYVAERRRLRVEAAGLSETEVAARLRERDDARRAGDFAGADRIKGDLAARGVRLRDSAAGTTWDVAEPPAPEDG